MSMVVIGNHQLMMIKDIPISRSLADQKKKVDKSVNIPDIERSKMLESIICIKIIFSKHV